MQGRPTQYGGRALCSTGPPRFAGGSPGLRRRTRRPGPHRREDNMANTEPTISFSIKEDREKELKKTLTTVYEALLEKGYNPINQLVGYILSEDPTYITTHNNARGLIRHIDRDELLQVLLRSYLER